MSVASIQSLTIHPNLFMHPYLWWDREITQLQQPRDSLVTETFRRIHLFVLYLLLPFIAISTAIAIAVHRFSYTPPVSSGTTPGNYPPELAPIVAAQKRLEIQFEELFKDLKGLLGIKGNIFKEQLRLFRERYGKWEGDDNCAKIFGHVDYMQKTYLGLIEASRGLFSIASHFDKSQSFPQFRDGNCLFHSFHNALTALKIEHPVSSELRTLAMNSMRAAISTDNTLKGLINGAIEAYVAKKETQLAEQQTALMVLHEDGEDVKTALDELSKEVEELSKLTTLEGAAKLEAYFKLAEQNAFHGSRAEIHTLSHMYGICIGIERQIGGRRIVGFDPDVGTQYGPPAFILVHDNGDHFDFRLPDRE